MTTEKTQPTEEPVEPAAQTGGAAGSARKPAKDDAPEDGPLVKFFMYLAVAVVLAVVWLFICTIMQVGVRAASKIALWLVVIVFGIVKLKAVLRVLRWLVVPVGTWPAVGLAVAVLWLYVVGSYHLAFDLLILAVSFLTPMLASKEARDNLVRRVLAASGLHERYQVMRSLYAVEADEPRPLGGFKGFKICVVFLFSFWVLSSLADAWGLGRPVPRDPANFARLRERVDADGRWPRARVGLALSGGGYRAVLMHAGVLDALERLRVPVTNLSTVSGGSIVGAFYATGGSPAALRDAVKDGRFRLTRSLTDAQNLSRLGFPFQVPGTEVKLFKWYEFSRSDVQADLLDKVLLGGSTLAGMRGAQGGAPELMVCATDLHTGALFGFHSGGVLRRHIQHPSEKQIFRGLGDEEVTALPSTFKVVGAAQTLSTEGGPIGPPPAGPLPRLSPVAPVLAPDREWLDSPLARLVAASGAFPGAFNAIREKLPVRNKGFEEEKLDLLLADGGITDNSALSIMEYARQKALEGGEGLEGWKDLNLALSSDASALLSEDKDLTSLGELTRAVDIVYANIGSTAWDPNLPKLLLSPAACLDTRALSNSLKAEERSALLKAQVSKAIARLMPKLDEESLALLVEAASREETKRALKDVIGYLRLSKPEGDSTLVPAGTWETAQGRLADEFASCSEVFLRASTLTDQFEREDADSLYRLGQFLVAFNWPFIKVQLMVAGAVQPDVTTADVAEAAASDAGGAGEEQRAEAAAAEPAAPTQPVSARRPRGRRGAAQPR